MTASARGATAAEQLWQFQTATYGGIATLDWSVPAVVDIDADADLDMLVFVIGDRAHFFRNDGNADEALWTLVTYAFVGVPFPGCSHGLSRGRRRQRTRRLQTTERLVGAGLWPRRRPAPGRKSTATLRRRASRPSVLPGVRLPVPLP